MVDFTSVRFLIPAALAFGACALILFGLLRTGWAWSLAIDVPNQRSLHTRPIPRVGGWGIVPASAVLIAIFAPQMTWAAVGAAVLAAVSQLDDRRGLPARTRFGVHSLVVGALVLIFPGPAPWWVLLGMSFLLLWLVNLYNFMDGADGLAAGMALFGFSAYAFAAFPHALPLAVATSVVAATAAAFLLFNFHPAKIFLGDAGSIPLGFWAGAFGYLGWGAGVWPVWFPAMIFSAFIADASITLLRRILRREKFWEAHREHYYQRMVQMGWGHGRTAKVWYLLIASSVTLGLFGLHAPIWGQWTLVGTWAICLAVLAWYVDRRWLRFNKTRTQS